MRLAAEPVYVANAKCVSRVRKLFLLMKPDIFYSRTNSCRLAFSVQLSSSVRYKCRITTAIEMSNIISQGYIKEFIHAPAALLKADAPLELPADGKNAAVSAACSIKDCYG